MTNDSVPGITFGKTGKCGSPSLIYDTHREYSTHLVEVPTNLLLGREYLGQIFSRNRFTISSALAPVSIRL